MQLTPTSVKSALDVLKQQELDHFNQADIHQLIATRTAFYDELLISLWQQFELNQIQDLCLLAVGGYGRQEMFPLSDLDFLLLSEQPIATEIADKISQYVQFLWDCGLNVGHAVRTLAECEQQGRSDITIATNLFEQRYLCGNQSLVKKLEDVLAKPDFWAVEDFFQAKISEQTARYQRYHNTSYNLEPDVKYSPGGLRDLHLLYWIALRHTGAKNLADILQAGFIYPEEYQDLQQCQNVLFRVRFALHLILKRYDNRLLFDRQLKVSEILGYRGLGNQGVEKMMKDFFQALQGIALLSDIIVKYYQEHFLQNAQKIDRSLLDEHFELVNGAICLRQSDCFQRCPDCILDLFYHLTQQPEAVVHSFTLRQLQLALRQQQDYLNALPLAREKFIRLFSQPQAIQRAFLPMHKYGVLNAYLPQWQGITGLMQFDLFHNYTVDEHSLRVMLKLESFLQWEAAQSHPICSQIFRQISDRTLLYIAALFHDIAKGRGGDHAELGAQDIRQFAQQHGFDRRETETMAWLVEQHLLMSITAQRRDIHDPEVVMHFAEKVQNKVRLDYLTCLTVADICATNETLWNSWKRALFATLYQYANQQFHQGMDNLLDYAEKIARHRQQAMALLSSGNYPFSADWLEQAWQRYPDEYFLRHSPEQLLWHAELLYQYQQGILVKVSNRFSQGGTQIFVYCADQPYLFNKVVSTIGAKKLRIHDAQILTTQDGYAVDTFIITELDGSLLQGERRRLLEQALYQALQSDKLPKLPTSNHKLQHFTVPTEVRFLKTEKADQTEMELFALDKTGLLAEISTIFTELNLNLLNAKITTIGERAEDFFILSNGQNNALTQQEKERLEQLILQKIS